MQKYDEGFLNWEKRIQNIETTFTTHTKYRTYMDTTFFCNNDDCTRLRGLRRQCVLSTLSSGTEIERKVIPNQQKGGPKSTTIGSRSSKIRPKTRQGGAHEASEKQVAKTDARSRKKHCNF